MIQSATLDLMEGACSRTALLIKTRADTGSTASRFWPYRASLF